MPKAREKREKRKIGDEDKRIEKGLKIKKIACRSLYLSAFIPSLSSFLSFSFFSFYSCYVFFTLKDKNVYY